MEAHRGACLTGRWSHDGAGIVTGGEDVVAAAAAIAVVFSLGRNMVPKNIAFSFKAERQSLFAT